MIRSCLDLDAIGIDGSTGSDVQDQDTPDNQKMTHVSAMSSAYWNLFDNVDGISDKYRTT
jgi:hypothetical protein